MKKFVVVRTAVALILVTVIAAKLRGDSTWAKKQKF